MTPATEYAATITYIINWIVVAQVSESIHSCIAQQIQVYTANFPNFPCWGPCLPGLMFLLTFPKPDTAMNLFALPL